MMGLLLRRQILVFLTFFFPLLVSSNNFIINADYDQKDPVLEWCKAPENWQRPFMVAMVADPQVGWNLKQYNSEALFREAATHLKRLHPDLVLIAGDMIQTPMKEEFSELATAKNILEGLNIRYFLTSGNHDVFQQPGVNVLEGFKRYWKTPNYWYAVEYSNTLFVFLETNILLKYQDRTASQAIQQLAEEQLEWLETTLQNANYDHVVPIAHHPMAVHRIDEQDTGLNTPRKVRALLQKLYQDHPAITHVFGGHIHKKSLIPNEQGIDYIAYPSTGVVLGPQPSGFALLTVQGSQPLQEQYYGYNEMPRTRPDLPNASIDVTFPAGATNLTVHSEVCITWTSTSMANRVQLSYSTDLGATWKLIGEGPNVGVYPWRIPATLSDQVLVAVASVYDSDIIGASPEPNRIVLPPEATTSAPSSSPSVAFERNATVADSAADWLLTTNSTTNSTTTINANTSLPSADEEEQKFVWVRGGSRTQTQAQIAMSFEENSSTRRSRNGWTAVAFIAATSILAALLH